MTGTLELIIQESTNIAGASEGHPLSLSPLENTVSFDALQP